MYKYFISIAALIICASCTLGPDYERPQIFSVSEIKNELRLKENGKLPDNWYKNLQDDYLQKLIEIGLRNNSDILTAETKLRQARLIAKVNRTDFLPLINLNGEYDYQKGSKKTEYSQDADYYSAGFDASWELDIWGKGRRQSEADEADIKASIYNLENIKTVIAAEIASNYVHLQQSLENLRITKKNAELQKQIADIIKKEYLSGMGDAADYNQSQYLLQTTLAQIPQYENSAETYRNALSTLTGLLPSQIILPEKTNMPTTISADFLNNMRKLPIDVIRLRPDVAAAEQKLKAQNALIGKAVAELYPDVSIGGTIGYSAQKERDLFSSAAKTYGYSPNIILPLLDWDKLQNNVEIQKLQKTVALNTYKQSVLNAIGELKNAFSNCETSVRAYKNKLNALHNMQKVNELMLKRYQSGLIKFSEVLSSQQDLLNAQEELIAARTQTVLSLIAYYKASGATIDN